jgi:type VI secretion system protein ImpK
MGSTTIAKSVHSRSRFPSDHDLVSLVTPVFEIIMQLRAGLITPSGDMRREIDGLLKQMEQRGETYGHKAQSIQAVKFAVVAFVDETVLTDKNFPLREAWEKTPLQLEYFRENMAGVTFFNRLDEILKNPDSDPDVIETYYLCLLLGYEGKHKKYFMEQLQSIIDTVASHLRRANRLNAVALSPHWKVTDQPVLATTEWLPRWAKIAGSISLATIVFIYLLLKFFLNSSLHSAIEQLLR